MTETTKLEYQSEDLDAVRALFEEIDEPLQLPFIIRTILDRKKSGVPRRRIKIFDPRAEYEVGDLIVKKYDETLRAGKTRTIRLNEEVLLTVVDKFKHPVLPCTMLEVHYEGTGSFRLHTEFLAKTGAKLLLASAQSDSPIEPKFLEDAQDPRVKAQEPSPEEEATFIAALENEVVAAPFLMQWQDHWFLADRKIEINPGIIHRAEKLIRDHGSSIATEDILSEIFSTNTGDVKFTTFAISFNHTLENFYRKKFVCVSFTGWGRWNLLENLEAKKNSTLGLRDRLEDFIESIAGEEEILARRRERLVLPFLQPSETKIRMCLCFRDIISGAVRPLRLPPDFFGREREIPIRCDQRRFTIDFYPEFGLLTGFGDLFAGCRQADIVTLTREVDEYLLEFETSSTAVPGVGFRYDERRDLVVAEEELQNSSGISQEDALVVSEELHKIEPLQPEIHRRRDLYEATVKLFHGLGDPKKAYPMNVLKLYHLLDALAFVPWEKFLRLLLSYPAFYQRPEDVNEALFRLDLSKVSFDLGARPPVPAPVAQPAAAKVPPEEEEAPRFGLFAEKLQAALGTSDKEKKSAKARK